MAVNRLKNKRIAIVGYGIEGQSVARFLNLNGIEFDILDKNSPDRNIDTYKARIKTGKGYMNDLEDYEVVVRSPGIPVLSKELSEAKKLGIEVISATNLYYEFSPATTIGITGTKGKGTTASLIAAILAKDGKRVRLGGNIGKPPLDFLPKLTRDDFVVFEMSSFQLQDCQYSPHISVILNIGVDHLDYHKNKSEYVNAKTNIVRNQTKNDFCVLFADSETTVEFEKKTKAQVFWYSSEQKKLPGAWLEGSELLWSQNGSDIEVLLKKDEVTLKGRHNLDNVLASALTARLAGAGITAITQAASEFEGLEHRLQTVAIINGVEFIDDSYATQPEATIAAIKSCGGRPVIWIAGGSDKGADYRELAGVVCEANIPVVILMGDTSKTIKKELKRSSYKGAIITVEDMEEAVRTAVKKTTEGSIVLLSPASASFGLFANAKNRGEEFVKQVKKTVK